MSEFLNCDGLEIIAPVRPITLMLEVAPVDVELALASNGASLCGAIMTALIAEMTVDTINR